ncbi:MAG: tellurite resistance TerB family protein [Myxococcales bacterium]|nr:tellurite resistance TerB family protein [Myxococcales bacterium]MCB9578348.1 tellurite resistance TerB family protein [Polyangiaceae bacterium]
MIQLQPKTLQRIRDHLLDVGQPPSVHFMRVAADDDPFAGDPDGKARFEALFEAMYLMVVVDGEVADSEREVLRGAVRGLTDGSVRTHHIQKLFEKCDELVKQGIDKRIAAIAPTLKEDPALSEAAFSLASAIAFADSEIKDEENDLINELAGALDIDGDRAEELLNQLEADSE